MGHLNGKKLCIRMLKNHYGKISEAKLLYWIKKTIDIGQSDVFFFIFRLRRQKYSGEMPR